MNVKVETIETCDAVTEVEYTSKGAYRITTTFDNPIPLELAKELQLIHIPKKSATPKMRSKYYNRGRTINV